MYSIATLRKIIRQESPTRIEMGTVISADYRGIREVTVRLSGGRTTSRLHMCPEKLEPGDLVVVAHLEGMDRMVVIGQILDSYSSGLTRRGILAPPANFQALTFPGITYCQWDRYPGEDLSWEVERALQGDYSDATSVLVTGGSYYIYHCDPGTTVYFRARAIRWIGDNNLMYSGWSGWNGVVCAEHEVPNLIISLTNKSGGGVGTGYVVILDQATAESFTTTATEGHEDVVGVAMENIADDASGLVCISGYCDVLVKDNVSIGDYMLTSTTAGSAIGVAAKTVGVFGRALDSGTDATLVPILMTSTGAGSSGGGGGGVWGNVIVVAKSGGQYTAVQNGLSAASVGDTVLVMPGTYTENLSASTTNLTIQGLTQKHTTGPHGTLISGSDDTGPILSWTGNGGTVCNLLFNRTLAGGAGDYVAVDASGGQLRSMIDCRIHVSEGSTGRTVVPLVTGVSINTVCRCYIVSPGTNSPTAVKLAGGTVSLRLCRIQGDVICDGAAALSLHSTYIDGDVTGIAGATLTIMGGHITGAISGWDSIAYEQTDYVDTQANIEALTWLTQGTWTYASDISEVGYYDGGSWHWSDLDDTTIDHNGLTNLQGGQADQYYHLTAAQHTELAPLGGLVTTGLIARTGAATWVPLAPSQAGEAIVSNAGLGWIADATPNWISEHTFDGGLAVSAGQGITMADGAWTGIGAAAERIEYHTAGHVAVMGATFGVGMATPPMPLSVYSSMAHVVAEFRDASGYVHGSALWLQHANGSLGSPTSVVYGESLGGLLFSGYHADSGDYNNYGALIRAVVDGTPGDNDMPTRLELMTTADGTNWPVTHLTLDSDGNLGLNTLSPSRTYGTDPFLEIRGASNPGLVINDTGQVNEYLLTAQGNQIDLYYGATQLVAFSNAGNIGVSTATFGTNAAKVLGIANGTAPTTSPANMIQIFSVDCSDAAATLGLRTEQAVEAGAPTPSHKLKMLVNGTEYWLSLDAV